MVNIKTTLRNLLIYKFLVDGHRPNAGLCPTQIAEKIGISRQAIKRYCEKLEVERYIERIPRHKNPVFYHRGPKSNVMDKACLDLGVNLNGGTVCVNYYTATTVDHKEKVMAEVPTSRAHLNGKISFEVISQGDMCHLQILTDGGGKLKLTIFEKEPYFTHNNVQKWKGKVQRPDLSCSVEYEETRNKKHLYIWPSEVELIPEQFDKAKDIFIAQAISVTNLLSKYGGWEFGNIQLIGDVEFPSTDPHLLSKIPENIKSMPNSPLWVDSSVGEREIETNDPKAARDLFDFPNTVKRIDNQQQATSNRIYDLEARVDKLTGVMDKLVDIAEKEAKIDTCGLSKSVIDNVMKLSGEDSEQSKKKNDTEDQNGVMYR